MAEIILAAVENAQENAKLNGLNNTQFLAGPVEKLLPQLVSQGLQPDLVVLDPPRKGCEKEVLEAIAQAKVSWATKRSPCNRWICFLGRAMWSAW